MQIVFTTPDGLQYEAVIIPQGSLQDRTVTACSLCEVKQCDITRCREWRENATLSLSCMPRTYFKQITRSSVCVRVL